MTNKGTRIERPEMASFITKAKLQAVARLVRFTQDDKNLAAANEYIISGAMELARAGRSTDAFRQMAKTRVPAGRVANCCGLRSAQYGCATHGYPRTN